MAVEAAYSADYGHRDRRVKKRAKGHQAGRLERRAMVMLFGMMVLVDLL